MKTGARALRACAWAAVVLLWGVARTGNSALIPTAETESALSISAAIEGGAWILASPSATAYASTASYSTVMASGTRAPLSLHVADASASADAETAPPVFSGAYALDPTQIAAFQTRQTTLAGAWSAEPLFARSAAISIAGISGVGVEIPAGSNPSLDLTWDIASLGLQAEPTAAFSLIRQTVTVVQSPFGDGTVATLYNPVATTLGFALIAEDGQIMSSVGDGILAGPSSFTEQIPLSAVLSAPGAVPQEFDLSVQVTQVSYSAEAPPAATERVAEQAGATDGSLGMHWNAATGTLSFDPLPINILSNGGANRIDPTYLGDPLAGAFLDIGTLTFAGEANGRMYFTGDEISIVGANYAILFAASLPSMAFDDSLFSTNGFDLFAPILNILQEDSADSAWLQAFDARNTLDSRYLPELFVGFAPPAGGNVWANDFDAVPTAVLSFAGPRTAILAPSTVSILCVGLAALALTWRLRRPAAARARQAQ